MSEERTLDQSLTDQIPIDQVVQRLDSLVQVFEQHPIIQVRDEAMEMLGLIDALHREGLQRLVAALQAQEGTLLNQVLEDPVVRMLLTLYDLLPAEPREQVEAILADLGPSITSCGYTVEVLDVSDGRVHLHLDSPKQSNADILATLKQAIESALHKGFPGFASIEWHDQARAPAPVGSGSFIPLQQVGLAIRSMKHPVFTTVAPVESVPPRTLKGIEVEGKSFLLCNLDGEMYAYRNACPGSVLPLDLGELKGHTLRCPWHNCLYDVRTGKRLDGGQGRLEVIPVAVRDGMIQLALNVASKPSGVTQVVEKLSRKRVS
jgi:nitrite reductase/ring-hydroxylating ferredoxin subunit/Fe-S cluster biogenesis protein NfuA